MNVAIAWVSFRKFDLQSSSLEGSLQVEYSWIHPIFDYVIEGDVRDVAVVTNFATGLPGRVKAAGIEWHDDDIPVEHLHMASTFFVGDFTQTVDGTCYPFDTQTVKIELAIPAPFSERIRLALSCGEAFGSTCSGFTASGEEVSRDYARTSLFSRKEYLVRRTRQSNNRGRSAVGYTWSDLTCVEDSSRISCTMVAKREPTKSVLGQILPGIVMMVIGLVSFLIPVELAMPRVTTTMIALLTFVGQGAMVTADLARHGWSVVESFYLGGVMLILFYMIGHILSFHFDHISNLIGDLAMTMTSLLFVFLLTLDVHSKGCTQIPATVTTFMFVAEAVMLFVSTTYSFFRHRASILEHLEKRRAQARSFARTMTDSMRTPSHPSRSQ